MTGTLGETVRMNAEDEDISETVINAVADAKGVDPLDLDPLCDVIDPDALDALFNPVFAGASVTRLGFEMADCDVLVRGSGEVVVSQATTAGANAEQAASLD